MLEPGKQLTAMELPELRWMIEGGCGDVPTMESTINTQCSRDARQAKRQAVVADKCSALCRALLGVVIELRVREQSPRLPPLGAVAADMTTPGAATRSHRMSDVRVP